MNVLIACEMSGRVRRAFADRGHFAVSCDLLPSVEPWHGFNPWHYQGDIFELLSGKVRPFYSPLNERRWDMLIGFPPCTHLAGSGARWLTDHWVTSKKHPGGRYWHSGAKKRAQHADAYEFFMALWNARNADGSPIPKCALENPVGRMSTLWRKPDQIIEPWQFWTGEPGTGEKKATCIWKRGLPALVPTTPNETGRHQACWRMPPSKDRAILRSLTYPGIAAAMAAQWGA